jgi:hypothetical protein
MLFADSLQLDRPRKTADGYLVARARASRSGIYEYLGREVDPEGNTFAADQVVKVYRSEDEVFAKDSVSSFLMKPVTNDHPSQPVTADNWRDFAKGVVGKALRDGEYLAFDIVLMDKATIADVEQGKRELSNGYASLIDFTPGEVNGQQYDAVQKQIRGNHVAVVDKGRAGPMCRIGDAQTVERIPAEELIAILTDERTYNGENRDGINDGTERRETSNSGGSHVATKTITFDGLPLEVTDAAEAAITKLQNQIKSLSDDKAAAETKVGELTATVSTKDGEIAALEQKLKDAEIKPEQLEKLVKDRAELIGQAKAIDANIVTDGKTEAEIRKAVVSAKLGDSAKDMDDAAISGAFKVLAKDVKIDPVRNALSGGAPVNVDDARGQYEKSRDAARKNLSDAWKGEPASAA